MSPIRRSDKYRHDLSMPNLLQYKSALKAAPPASALGPGMIIATVLAISLVVFGAGLWRVIGR